LGKLPSISTECRPKRDVVHSEPGDLATGSKRKTRANSRSALLRAKSSKRRTVDQQSVHVADLCSESLGELPESPSRDDKQTGLQGLLLDTSSSSDMGSQEGETKTNTNVSKPVSDPVPELGCLGTEDDGDGSKACKVRNDVCPKTTVTSIEDDTPLDAVAFAWGLKKKDNTLPKLPPGTKLSCSGMDNLNQCIKRVKFYRKAFKKHGVNFEWNCLKKDMIFVMHMLQGAATNEKEYDEKTRTVALHYFVKGKDVFKKVIKEFEYQ